MEDKFFHFVDRFQYQSFRIPSKQLTMYGIRIERINFVDKHDFIGYSLMRNVDNEKLQQALEDKALNPKTKADLQKLLEMDDPEMPLIVRFRLNHPKTYE